MHLTDRKIKTLRARLLAHYEAAGRDLPWRIRPESTAQPDPYAIWLSEIMCQQTTTTAAAPYWHKFLQQWPDVHALAAADLDDVLAAWAGLGYYARARNAHKCANIVAFEMNGEFPRSAAGLIALPGIGAYVSAAMAAICYGEAVPVVDGNVERVLSRLAAITVPMPKARTPIRALAAQLTGNDRPGDYAQALMDLGAHVCRPRNPKCSECPWAFRCEARKQGHAEHYPVKAPKKDRPHRCGAVFYLRSGDEILLARRPKSGLLAQMMELPGTDWSMNKSEQSQWMRNAPAARNWQYCGDIDHVFTHFSLTLSVYAAHIPPRERPDGIWAKLAALDKYALPSVMMKAIGAGRAAENK